MPKVQTRSRRLGRYEKWLTMLEGLGVEFLVLDAYRDKGLVQAARSSPKWTIDLEDKEAVLFARAAA